MIQESKKENANLSLEKNIKIELCKDCKRLVQKYDLISSENEQCSLIIYNILIILTFSQLSKQVNDYSNYKLMEQIKIFFEL